jgi:protein-S-isoprenylcysteine O-methyltransferase Ste14
MRAYFVLALLWAAYCAVHSALISITVTGFFKKLLGHGYRFYRFFFNLFSVGTLGLLAIYSRSSYLRDQPLFTWDGKWRTLQCCLAALAILLILSGTRHYDMQQFLGIRQMRRSKSGMTKDSGDFETTGVLGVIRHPWYLAVFILIWASELNLAAITINLVLSAYLVVGTFLEERKLVFEFGDRYRSYQKQVSMFIPLKWLSRKGGV